MNDRIVLSGMAFQARHGVHPWEKVEAQRFEVDVELALDVQSAGIDDDLTKTVDYGSVYQVVRQVVESTTFNLIEALAEAIAHEILGGHADFGSPGRGWDFVSPGHGDVDFEALLRALNRIGYEGPLSIEWEDSGMDREYGARDALAFVRKSDFAPSRIAFDAAFAGGS